MSKIVEIDVFRGKRDIGVFFTRDDLGEAKGRLATRLDLWRLTRALKGSRGITTPYLSGWGWERTPDWECPSCGASPNLDNVSFHRRGEDCFVVGECASCKALLELEIEIKSICLTPF